MAHITAEMAKPGMVLASEVKDRLGRLLLPAGIVLTEMHVSSLTRWDVEHIEIETSSSEVREGRQDDPEVVERVTRETALRFQRLDRSHPLVAALEVHAVRSGLEKLSGGMVRS